MSKLDFSSWQSLVLAVVRNVIGFFVKRLRGKRARKEKESEKCKNEVESNEVIIEEITVTRKRSRSNSRSAPKKKDVE